MERQQAGETDKLEVCPCLGDQPPARGSHLDGSCLHLALYSWSHHQHTRPPVQASTHPKRTEIKKWFHLRCDPLHPMRGEDEEQRLKTRQDELFEPFTHSKKGALTVKDSVLGARSPVHSSSGYFNDSELHFQGAVELTMIFS